MPDEQQPTGTRHVSGVKPPSALVLGSEARADWIRWKEDWNDYSIIQDIPSKPAEMQLALFRMALGPDGKKILRHQPTPVTTDRTGQETPMDSNKVETLIKMMEIAVNGEINDTFERYRFRHRLQREDEIFDEFLTDLRELHKRCNFCDCMSDKMLKDQVITGITDNNLRERLLQQRDITLTKCLDMCRAAESASSQAKEMSQAAAADINWVQNKSGYRTRFRPAGSRPPTGSGYHGKWKQCLFCGRHHPLTPGSCPAIGKRCNKCNGLNHFAAKCTQAVNLVAPDNSDKLGWKPPPEHDTDVTVISN